MKKGKYKFHKCEACGSEFGTKQWYNGKYLCAECASKAFIKYLSTLPIIALLIYLFLFLLYEVKNINSNSKKIVKKQEEIFGRMNINY